MQENKKQIQNGRSMIEMLGVLGVVGVLSVGGLAGYSKAMNKYRVNKTFEQVNTMSQNIRTAFATQKGRDKYKDLHVIGSCFSRGALTSAGSSDCNGAKVVKRQQLIPDEMYGDGASHTHTYAVRSNTGIENSFGGSVGVEGNEDGFMIEMDNVTADACIDLVTKDWVAVSAGIEMIMVNHYPYCKNSDSWYGCDDRKLPIPVDRATELCRDGVWIVFGYR